MKNHPDSTAEEIADDLLYRTGQGLKRNDFQMMRRCFDIPNMIETTQGKRMIKTEQEFFKTFEDMRNYYKANCVVDVARIIISSEFLDSQTIGSTHASRLILQDGTLFLKPYPVYSIIKFLHGNWKIVSSIYAILDSPQLNVILHADKAQRIDPDASP